MKKTILLILVSNLFLSSCIKTTHISGASGNLSNTSDLENLSKDEVLNKLGSPTSINHKVNETWLYVADHYEKIAFLPQKIIKQEALVIKFDQNKVTNISYYSNQDLHRIKYSKLSTPSFGDDTTLLKEMFSNLGRFNVKKRNKSM